MRTLLLALAATLVMATPAEAVPQWLAPIDVGGPSDLNMTADSAVAPDGTTLVAYTQFVGGFERARARVRRPGQDFGQIFELSPADRQASAPSAGVDQQGNFTVAWTVDDPTTEVRAARLPAGAGAFEPTETVSSGNAAFSPALAVGGNGTAVIAYLQDNALQAAIRLGAGGQFGGATTISDAGPVAYDVAVDDAGDAIAIWSRNTSVGTTDIIEVSERPAGFGFPPPGMARMLSPNLAGEKATGPALAMAPDGRVLALWTHQVGSGLFDVQYTERTPNGTWLPAPLRASKQDEQARLPDVALAANGTAVAAWIATVGSGDLIQAASHPPDGTFAGYRNFAATSAGVPLVAGNRAGDATLAWNGSMGEGVFAVRRPAGGDFGSVDTVALGTQGTADPAISLSLQNVGLDDQGNATAYWRRDSFSSSTTTSVITIQASSYDAAGPSLDAVSVPPTGTPGGAIGMAATASDRLSVPTIAWSFGDGASGSGPAVSHAYGAPGAYSVTVTATDGAGNSTSTSRSVVIAAAAGPPPTPRVDSPVLVLWGVAKKRIYLLRLKITQVPQGGKVELRCKGRKCPYKRKSSTRRRKGAITIFKEIKPTKVVGKRKRSFRAGQRLQLRVTAPGHIGKVVKYKLRKGRIPSGRNFCLPLGATKPQKVC